MSFEQTHIAYQVTDDQHQLTNRYIARMRGPSPSPDPASLGQLLSNLLDQTLYNFLLRPAELLELKGSLKRVIKVGAGVMTKAASFLIKRTVNSLSREKAIESADYLENSRVLSEDDAGREIGFAAFPIKDRTAEELTQVIARIKDGHYGHTEKAQLSAVMVQIAEAGVDAFMREPIQMMQFSGLMGTLAKNTEQTIVKSIDRLIADLFPKLTHDQAVVYATYLEELILCVEVTEIDA